MPLLDHFHPPLSATRHWESFHASWATGITATLNRGVLPQGYFAEAQVHIGSRVEVDVASSEDENETSASERDEPGGGVAVARWAPPAATLVIPAIFPDEVEVQVFSTATGATLVAAIELISPDNKDRPEARRAFAAKCAGYLPMGIGLVRTLRSTPRPDCRTTCGFSGLIRLCTFREMLMGSKLIKEFENRLNHLVQINYGDYQSPCEEFLKEKEVDSPRFSGWLCIEEPRHGLPRRPRDHPELSYNMRSHPDVPASGCHRNRE